MALAAMAVISAATIRQPDRTAWCLAGAAALVTRREWATVEQAENSAEVAPTEMEMGATLAILAGAAAPIHRRALRAGRAAAVSAGEAAAVLQGQAVSAG